MRENKKIIFTLLILILVSCQKKEKQIDLKNELKGKTFNMINEKVLQTDFEFKDSTYTVYQFKKYTSSYSITIDKGVSYIILGKYKSRISKSASNAYDFLIVDINTNDSTLLKEKKARWNADKIYGNWIEENRTQKELEFTPYYSINDNEIVYQKKNGPIKSDIRLNKTKEYLEMSLVHSSKRTDIFWRIKNITDSTMTIDRISKSDSISHGIRNNLKLSKIR